MKEYPLITLFLGVCVSLLMLLPQPIQTILYFDHQLVALGYGWTLISGHWIHVDLEHLKWNVLTLIVLASIIEIRSKTLLVVSLLMGMICVDVLLFSSYNSVQRYCGLSGILNTLMGIVIYIYWIETRSMVIIFVGILCLGKIAIEIIIGQAIFTHNSWPPYPMAHLAGILAAPLVIVFYHCMAVLSKKSCGLNKQTGFYRFPSDCRGDIRA